MLELDSTVVFAFLLTLGAGLSTGLGSALGLLNRGFSPRVLTLALSFSAGVMLYVSFVEIFPKARQSLSSALGSTPGYWATVLAFFGGILAIALIDRLLPTHENGLTPALQGLGRTSCSNPDLLRTGLFSALAIASHNVPEGLATFIGALSSPRLGIGIAIAIDIHNIPEGLAVSAPIYYATGSRRKAFWISLASGLAEPVGAVVGFVFLGTMLNNHLVLGLVFASVAGVMIYICLDELLPTAQRMGSHHHLMIGGVLAGMVVMSLSLLLLI
ncbi:MAG: zinc transporter ZupT [Cyanobacteriota bacterium]